MDLKIVGWASFDSSFPSASIAQEDVTNALAIIVKEILENGYMLSGNDHQNSDTGVPVFNDGTCFRASMRTWGLVMSAAYPELDGKKTNYMDFYMSTPMERNLPKPLDTVIEPSDSDNFNGFMISYDTEMLSQSLSMGIPFMTTDKVLNSYMEQLKNQKDDGDDK